MFVNIRTNITNCTIVNVSFNNFLKQIDSILELENVSNSFTEIMNDNEFLQVTNDTRIGYYRPKGDSVLNLFKNALDLVLDPTKVELLNASIGGFYNSWAPLIAGKTPTLLTKHLPVLYEQFITNLII